MKNADKVNHRKNLKSLTTSSCCEGISTDCSGTILVFDDTAHFREVYECLESEYETWNDDFETTYGSLNEDQYNYVADSLGFDGEETLESFEDCLSFLSYRAKLREDEETWMSYDSLDPGTDPENTAPTDDDIMLTLLSNYGEVIIGGTYYRYLSDGTVFEYPGYKCEDIETLRGNPNANIEGAYKTTFGGGETDSCTAWKSKVDWVPYTSGYKYKKRVSIRNFLINCTASSKMTSYKKKTLGWRKWRAKLSVQLTGTLRNNSCDFFTNFANSKEKKRKKLVVRSMVWDPHIYRTEQNETYGYFAINNGYGSYLYLSW